MNKVPASLRKQVVEQPKCYWCGYTSANASEFDADHLIPKSLGGPTTLENLVCACSSCNRSRQAKPASRSIEWVSRSVYYRMTEVEKSMMATKAMLNALSARKGRLME